MILKYVPMGHTIIFNFQFIIFNFSATAMRKAKLLCHIPLRAGIDLLRNGGMDMEERKLPHKLTLNERRELTMTGVTEVVSFEDTAVVLKTSLGTLILQGSGLKLKTLSLDGGQVAVDGTISAMVYQEPRAAGFLQRFFG